MELSGITAIVTGAASGLGAATSRLLAERGASVVGLDLPAAIEGKAVPGVRFVGTDVTSREQVAAALATIGESDPPVRLVVNCAGIAPARRLVSSAGPHDSETFRRVIEINVVGTFTVMALAAERMAAETPDAAGQRGVVINTASVAAFEGQVGQVAYSASKGAVVGMTLPAARDLARFGIRVNTIAPGIVDTPMMASFSQEVRDGLARGVTFPQRLARPDEYAQLVATIAEHDYLNGETIRMDGALRMAAQ